VHGIEDSFAHLEEEFLALPKKADVSYDPTNVFG
jgi:hypothetical protein